MNNLIVPKKVMYTVITLLMALGVLWTLMSALQAGVAAQTSVGHPLSQNREFATSFTDSYSALGFSITLAAYQAWFGLDSHIKPPPYVSTDTTVISSHITAALARGINGFVVDWYGPMGGVTNDQDRKFIDEVAAKLLQLSQTRSFSVALMYDEGTVSAAETLTTAYTTRVISDLLFARQYYTMPAYLHIKGHPALFVFPYDTVDPYVNWNDVRNQLGISITLLDKDPDLAHDDEFDGFYAWVQPPAGQWRADGTEWGEGYLTWFYDTMATVPYTDNITIGAIWPGFDDSFASWGSGRYMWRRCGQTWRDTWRVAAQRNASIVMIDTWNDFEEGTDIEYGTGECLTPLHDRCALLRGKVVYPYTLANTGKFTDTFNMQVYSSNAWPTVVSPTSITLIGHAAATLAVTLTVPESVSIGMHDMLVVTATSELSTAVRSSVVNTTTACGCLLPIVLKDYTGLYQDLGASRDLGQNR